MRTRRVSSSVNWAAALVGAASVGVGGALVGAGCGDVTVQVLAPGASASVAPTASCGPPAPSPCVGQVGDECKDEKKCCSGACLVAEDGKKRCARPTPTACRSYCETCEVGADCCSGRCESDGEAFRCMTGTCRAQGELCGGDPDCCKEAGPVRCIEDPVGLKAHRCRLESSGPPCTGDGVRCAKATDCCSGYCIGLPAADAVCGSCVADGSPCAAASDCCSAGATCALGDTDTVCTPEPVP